MYNVYCLRSKVLRVRHVGSETCLSMWLKKLVEEILKEKIAWGTQEYVGR